MSAKIVASFAILSIGAYIFYNITHPSSIQAIPTAIEYDEDGLPIDPAVISPINDPTTFAADACFDCGR